MSRITKWGVVRVLSCLAIAGTAVALTEYDVAAGLLWAVLVGLAVAASPLGLIPKKEPEPDLTELVQDASAKAKMHSRISARYELIAYTADQARIKDVS